jgi:hypothetical protein
MPDETQIIIRITPDGETCIKGHAREGVTPIEQEALNRWAEVVVTAAERFGLITEGRVGGTDKDGKEIEVDLAR